MKIEARYISKNNKLCMLSGEETNLKVFIIDSLSIENAVPTEVADSPKDCVLCKVLIDYKIIEPEKEAYNESFLATLRDFLKVLEEKNIDAVIVPCVSSLDEQTVMDFTACMKHTARRIKDCKTVIGFELPKALCETTKPGYFIEQISEKHEQYLYFVNAENMEKLDKMQELSKNMLILY